jgi:Ca2+:H+ antiporter
MEIQQKLWDLIMALPWALLHITFGNADEIIISLSAINVNLFTFVKATITGSILDNILLIF